MKIIVTGGAGFIGSHLVESLLNDSHELLIFDNYLTGKKDNLSFEGNFKLVEDDFGSKESLALIKNFDSEICFHLAAQSSVVVSVQDPSLDFEHNILQPIQLLNTLINSNCKKFIFTSSGGTIFGEPKIIPTAESDYSNEPASPYGIAKKKLNEIIKIMTSNTPLSYSILNLSNVYGPRQDPHGEAGVVSIFSNKYLNGERPVIYGNGEQTRDYIFVQDVISALIKSSKIQDNLFLNIGTGIETSVNQLSESLKTQFSSDLEPIYKDARAGELQRSVLDNTKARKLLNWEPQYDLDTGMVEVKNWIKP
ncbi:MAG: GDP-mannose 4,6-dehydratase [Candidatus Actinomarina sp.]|tara:strand:+ start:4906 stop:5829 length:924 start_codon:yes stop_codon:yes gene_type:complete